MELLSNGNLPLTVILKSVVILCGFLGENQETFMAKIGANNKKLYSKLKVLQSGNWKKSLEKFREIYSYLETNKFFPIEEKISNTRKSLDEEIHLFLQKAYLNFKSKINYKQNVEFLVNLLIPREKWIEIGESSLVKLINFYYNKSKSAVNTKSFENFILFDETYKKYYSYFSPKITNYYSELIFNKKFKRYEVYSALKFKDKYEELFKDLN